MKEKCDYEKELRKIGKSLRKNFNNKYSFINELRILHNIKKIIKLNKRTKNEHIDELMYMIGRVKLQYRKHCHKNDYYVNSEVNQRIKNAYKKLSKKSMKIKTRKSTINKTGKDLKIEYNSERGSYKIKIYEKDGLEKIKYYKIKNIKNLDRKRKRVLEDLKRLNFGINVFDELDVDEDKSYKLNPDIIHILVKEGKIDYAKMYIKNVLDESVLLYKPFEIRYELNKDLSKGVFSREENKNMKKMAKYDRLATSLIIIGKKKKIKKPKVNVLQKAINYTEKGGIRKNNVYIFDSAKVERIMEMKKRIAVPETRLPDLRRNDGTRQIVTGIRRTNNISGKKIAGNLVRVQYEKEVV